MSLDAVSAVIGATSDPPWPVDWSGVERRLGIGLPAEYKAFAERYGPVLVGEWLTVLVPHDSANGGYFAELDQHHGIHRSMRDEAPHKHPYAFHPEADGLLAWGRGRRGEVFFWNTFSSDDPDDWPTRVWAKPDSYGPGTTDVWRAFGMPTLKVIVSLVRGELALHPSVSRPVLPARTARLAWPITPVTLEAPTPDRPSPAELREAGRALAETVRGGSAAPLDEDSAPVPADYLEFSTRLGPGTLAGQLRLLVPGGPDGFDLETEHTRHADRLRAKRAASRPVVPTPIAPEPAGLHLWGVFETGETCWWLPADRAPSRWPLVLVDADGVGWQRLNLRTTEFLAQWLDGGLDLPVLSLAPQRLERTLTASGHAPDSPPLPPTGPRDTVAQLHTIIRPREPHDYDWDRLEGELGFALPTDYKRLLSSRGAAHVNGVYLTDPDSFVADHELQAKFMREWSADKPARGRKVWPEPGGLLLCATTESRDIVWWDTTDPDPDRWKLSWDVVYEQHTFAGTITELLIADLTGRLESDLTLLTPSDAGPFDN